MEVVNKENSNFRFYKKKIMIKFGQQKRLDILENYYIVLIKKIYIIYGQIIHIILQKKRKSYLIKKILIGKNSFRVEIKEQQKIIKMNKQ